MCAVLKVIPWWRGDLDHQVDAIFLHCDINGDGKVSLEEFCRAGTADPHMVQTLSIYQGVF